MPLHTLANPPEIEPCGQESISIEVDGIELGATTESMEVVNHGLSKLASTSRERRDGTPGKNKEKSGDVTPKEVS